MKDICTFAIIGYGGMGERHSIQLKEVERAALKGVYDIDPSRMECAQSNGYKAYLSLEELLMDSGIDIVIIATPNDTHREIVIDALRAGKNVICEKPAALSSREMTDMMQAEKETGRLLVVHQNRRWDEDYLTVKKIYDEKTIGNVYHIETRIHGSRGIPGDWRKEKARGGGILLDWGVHLIDRLLIMVDQKIKTVFCKLSYVLGEDADDGFIMHLLFEDGTTAIVGTGTNNFITLPKWYVCGSEGTAVIEDWDMNGHIEKRKYVDEEDAKPIVAGAGVTKTMAPRDENTIVKSGLYIVYPEKNAFYNNVIDSVFGKSTPIVTNEQVLRVMRLMEAAIKSHETGQVVGFE